MRIGLVLPERDTVAFARAADAAGLAAVVVDAGDSSAALAAEVAALTTYTRLVVPVRLGSEHPVTLAEEIAVIDQLSGGRAIALVDTAGLSAAEAAEDLGLLREAWSSRWITHSGPRWTVPAGRHGESSPEAIAVTPSPAQIEVPVWLRGSAADELAVATGLPRVHETGPAPASVDRHRPTPLLLSLSGSLDADREAITAAVASGASIALVSLARADVGAVEQHIARYLLPEAAMPVFPRIIAESRWPARWPGSAEPVVSEPGFNPPRTMASNRDALDID
ncbi:LLM class flavin-dependent oxidoreductase [Agromyces atrinae]|uniref:LLM class flavin-dependent oxidoreductase n=1 Tax=Agromyces atrinae TaxID=592376 RepID=UPI001F57A523|nr:LLM class flavin-dependent oxidoreductase [Agromyces atrinae]MCI2956540.1 LLM class flavin-dependent oxidoreductase [Agromyces atrinae]